MHIENLYRPQAQSIFLLRECFTMEKIHGTSAHVAWKDKALRIHSGGEKHERFSALFDAGQLEFAFIALGQAAVTVYGEAYGGKCQGMSQTYGKDLRFVAFDVKIGDSWLSVPQAEDVTKSLGLEFVHYRRVSTDLAALDAERDAPSEQARRNGIEGDKLREGIVIRPIVELTLNNGDRMIAKHKRAEFSERAGPGPDLRDPTEREMIAKADSIALEFVTDMRLSHVLDKLGNPTEMSATGKVIEAMVEDVCREASGEIVDSKAARKAIGQRAAKLFKAKLTAITSLP